MVVGAGVCRQAKVPRVEAKHATHGTVFLLTAKVSRSSARWINSSDCHAPVLFFEHRCVSSRLNGSRAWFLPHVSGFGGTGLEARATENFEALRGRRF
jgi:hypothetical protein